MTDEQQLARLKRSVNEWNWWREGQPNLCPDLTAVDLDGMDLSHADLAYANLEDAGLEGCDLSFANLRDANLAGARLSGANLREANLRGANLWDTNVSRGNLSEANLEEAILKNTVVTSANFSHARFCETVLVQVDLRSVTGLETVIHDGPSAVDIHSVVLPGEEQTRLLFQRGVGFSDALIDALPSLLTAIMASPRYFLRYTSQDETLAQRLHQDLQAHGVRCWLMPYDLHPDISHGLHPREKVVLLLSEHTVRSSWVQLEVHATLQEERKQDAPVLFPLRVDEAVMQTEQDWAMQLRENRPISDFTGWQDDAAYQQAFTTLLRHLKVTQPPKA